MTAAERRLWGRIRAHRFLDAGFRRQVPIGRYVVDFVCHQARLVIEVDGNQHGYDDNRAHDDIRTTFIEAEGYRVLRFWNDEVFKDIDGVMHRIGAALGKLNPDWLDTPLPTPPPQGGREAEDD